MRSATAFLLAAIACHEGSAPVPPPDAASVLTAAGVEKPRGLDWTPAVASQPARATFRNVHALGGVTSERFMAAMQSMKTSVGLECRDCHVDHDFPSDEKKPKVRAREMLRMTARIDLDLFGGRPVVTCFTCHRGTPRPEVGTLPPPRAPEHPPAPLPASDASRPATEVYRNLQVLDEVTAGQIVPIMTWFTQQLGVACTHCHAEGAWASDEKSAKPRARQMLRMVDDVARLFYQGSTPIVCGTCHRGEVRPARTPAELAAVQK